MCKKTLLLMVFLSAFILCKAEWHVTTEEQTKRVLIEEFTGIHCGYCPYAHEIVKELIKAQPDKVCAVAHHAGSYAYPGPDEPDFRLNESTELNNYFDISGYPAGTVNRQRLYGNIISNRVMWATYAHEQSLEVAPVNLWLSSSYDEATRQLTIDVEGYYTQDVEDESNLLNVMVTENNVKGPQSGGGVGSDYMHQHMVRAFVTGTWGETITNCKKGEYFSRQYVYDVPQTINDVTLNPAEFEVVAFVAQGNENIYNVISCRPDYPGLELPLAAEIDYALIPIGETYGFDYFDLVLENQSTHEITEATFDVTIYGIKSEVVWKGVAPARATTSIRVPFERRTDVNTPQIDYVVQLTGLNGTDYRGNKLSGTVYFPDYNVTPTIKLDITLDEYSDENRFFIKDMDGNVVQEFGPYPAGKARLIQECVALEPNSFYYLEVVDEWSNGIMGGSIVVYDAYGNKEFDIPTIEKHGCREFLFTSPRNVVYEEENKKVLIEEFTGIYCGNCPDAHVIIDELKKAQPDNVVALAYHAGHYADPVDGSGDPDYRTALGDTLDLRFVPDGYPNGMVNRVAFDENVYMYSRSMWSLYAHDENTQTAPVNIWVNSIYDNDTRTLTVDVEAIYKTDIDADINLLNVVIAQNHIVGPQNGGNMGDNYEHQHVVRACLTPIWGDTITACKKDDYLRKRYTYVVPEDINGVPTDPANFEVVAFICQDETNVLNVASCRPYYPGLELPFEVEIEPYRLDVQGGTYGYNYYEAYLHNNSTETVYSAQFTVKINGEPRNAEWVGEVKPRSTAHIVIPVKQTHIFRNSNDFTVTLKGINAVDYAGNSFSGDFQDPLATTPVNKFVIKTDNNADDNRYLIKDVDGKIVHEFGPYPAGEITEVTETLELPADNIYTLEVTDAWGNGVLNPRGSYKIYDVDGKLIAQMLEIEGHGCRTAFATTEESTGVDGVACDNTYKVVYNQFDKVVTVSSQHPHTFTASLYNAAGQCVCSQSATQELSMPVIGTGIYMVKITSAASSETVKILVR